MKVIKRDGRIVDFDKSKIKIAIEKGAIPFFKDTIEIKNDAMHRNSPFKLNIELLLFTLTSSLFKLRSAAIF